MQEDTLAAAPAEGISEPKPPQITPRTDEKEPMMAVTQPVFSSNLNMPVSPVAMMEAGIKWMEFTARNIESMLEATQGTMNHLKACQEASTALVRDRMGKSRDFATTAFTHPDFESMVNASAGYQRSLIEDYVRYGQRLGDMTLATINDHMAPLERRAEESRGKMEKAA